MSWKYLFTIDKINFLVLISSVVLFSECKKSIENTVVAHIVAEPDNLHPTNGASAERAEINLYTHLSLLRLNYQTGELMPCLVKDLPQVSNNGLNYTYEIKNDAVWDDGTPITGLDVAFTTKANKCLLTNNPALKPYWENIKDILVDSLNPKKFTVLMNRSYILNTWFWTDFPIIEAQFFDKKNTLQKYSNNQLCDTLFLNKATDVKLWADEFNSSKYYTEAQFLNGAGSYKVSKWEKGISVMLEKKQNHWTANYPEDWFCQAFPDKIIFKLNANNASTKLELKNQLIDVSTIVDISSFMELQDDKSFTEKYETKLTDTYNYIYLAMNLKPDGKNHQKLFNDVLVRKAISHTTPYEQINKIVYHNKNKRMIAAVSPLKKDFNTDLVAIDYNLDKAKILLNEAGWKDTDNDGVLDKIIDGQKIKFEFKVNFMSTQSQWEDLARQLTESMGKLGIKAILNPLDYNSYVTAAMTHDFDMMLGAWQSNAQPEDYSQLWHSASWQNYGLNFTGFGNTFSDALIDSINTCMDEEKRIMLSKRFQKIIYDEQPYVFLFTQTRRVLVNKKYKDYGIYTEYPSVLLNTLKID